MTLLKVENLCVDFPTPDGLVAAVHDTSFEINPGETLAIVGESGSGKTVTNLALMGLIPLRTANVTGSAIFESHDGPVDLLAMNRNDLRKYRGRDMAMIFQDPMSSLHPFYTIGDQIIEAHQVHNQVDEKVSKARAIELLEMVGIQGAATRLKSFPHQFSGGMRQRVMIAMALVNNPALLIADEPTTALDVTIQKTILDMMHELRSSIDASVIFITHDLGVIAEVADRVVVMYKGKIVEQGTVYEIFSNPQHPYTKSLLACRPPLNYRMKKLPVVSDFMEMVEDETGNSFIREKKVGIEDLVNSLKISDSIICFIFCQICNDAPTMRLGIILTRNIINTNSH
jgi:ABC-type dipeptide/oligopeptide/nickel transport system ATPase component